MSGCTTREDFCIVQGDDLRATVSVYDQSREEMDIQGAQSIRWWAARSVRHEPAIKKELDAGSLSLGGPNVFFFDLWPQDTDDLAPGNYYHEAEVITASGRVYTVMTGSLRIEPQLIRDP